MGSDLAAELTAFSRFVEQRLNRSNLSLEDSLQEFRQYQQQLADLQGKLQVAEKQSALGESGPLSIDETISKVRGRLAREGIID